MIKVASFKTKAEATKVAVELDHARVQDVQPKRLARQWVLVGTVSQLWQADRGVPKQTTAQVYLSPSHKSWVMSPRRGTTLSLS